MGLVTTISHFVTGSSTDNFLSHKTVCTIVLKDYNVETFKVEVNRLSGFADNRHR